MHPAPSIIFFTTFSGLGFGLLFWLGIDPTPPTGWVGFVFFALAFLSAVGGLMASLFHLGRPERAWRAFTQWKTSWLSREAWCAVLALGASGLFALGLVFFDAEWTILGWIGALFALLTVFTTSMIYTQLKTVPRWNTPLTPVLFLSLSLAGGALLSGRVTEGAVLLVIAGGAQALWWRMGDKRLRNPESTLESATGLGGIGKTRAFEPPHTGTNYLLREMVHVVGRKHAQKLRSLALALILVVPVLFLVVLPFNHFFALIALLAHVAGVLVSRWLFFAEAEHVVGLYYGKR